MEFKNLFDINQIFGGIREYRIGKFFMILVLFFKIYCIRVRKESYPIRREYRLFYKRYGLLMSQNDPYSYLVENNADFKSLTRQIFEVHFPEVDDNLVLFGHTKIFMRL